MIDINTLKVGDTIKCISNIQKYMYVVGTYYTVQAVDKINCCFALQSTIDKHIYWYSTLSDFICAGNEKQLTTSSKNFSATVSGDLFKVEAIGLSEEKINKIMDILCK